MYNIAHFFARHPVFSVADFAQLSTERSSRTCESLLAHHVRAGHILRVRRGLYAVVPPGSDSASFLPDPYLVAARSCPGAVLAYHSALSFHGMAHTLRNDVTFLSSIQDARSFSYRSIKYVPVLAPISLRRRGQEAAYVDMVDYRGMTISVTSIERTIVDCFDRIELAGGIEEVWRSLEFLSYIRLRNIFAYSALLDNAVTVARVGYWLEQNADRLRVKALELDFLRERRPKTSTYMFRDKRDGKLVKSWNLIVPEEVLTLSWEES